MNSLSENIPVQSEATIDTLKRIARAGRDSQVFSDRLLDVQREIRARRKAFLGTSVRLGRLVYSDGVLDHAAISVLADFLSTRTMVFWDKPREEGLWICHQFYELCLMAKSWVEMDDVILLANTAAMENTEIFMDVMTRLIPKNHFDFLASFVEDCLPLPISFEEAVLAAISVFTGVLKDPIAEDDNDG